METDVNIHDTETVNIDIDSDVGWICDFIVIIILLWRQKFFIAS